MKKEFLIGLGIEEGQIEDILSEHKKSVDILNDKLKTAKEDMQTYKADAEDKLLSNAVKHAIGELAQDSGLVAGLIDKSQLTIADDGSIGGITEQLESLKSEKAFLFKEQTLSGILPVASAEPKVKATDEMNYTELCNYLSQNPNADI